MKKLFTTKIAVTIFTVFLSAPILAGNLVLTDNANACLSTQETNSHVKGVETVRVQPAEVVLLPQIPSKVRLLSMNNSLIQRNEQWTVFNNMAASMGKDAVWTPHTMLGKTLMTHYNSEDAKPMVASEPWTHIILQELSSLPRTNYDSFLENVKLWVEYIRANCPNPNAMIMLPVNWGYNENGFADMTTQSRQLMESYSRVAQELGVTITPVGLAYQMLYVDKGVDYLATLYTDNRHPSAKATYLAACMEYAMIYGIDPTTITYAPADIPTDDISILQTYAKKAIDEYQNVVDHHRGMVRFTVKVTDQFGKEVTSAKPFSFSVNGGGKMKGNVFYSDQTQGTFTVQVSRGKKKTGQACVRVANFPVNVGVGKTAAGNK